MSALPLEQATAQARTASGAQLETLLYHRSHEVLDALLENPHLGEQHLLILLSRKDLAREQVAQIAQNKQWMKSYPLKAAVLKHPKTPRHLALPLLKFIYLFDLLGIAASPGVAPELKRLAEDAILAQREGLALGQRLSLARRGTHRIAAGLLADPNRSVLDAALANPAMTEQSVAAALLLQKASGELTLAVAGHPRWSAQHSVKLALLRSKHLSLARFAGILSELPSGDLNDLVEDPRVGANLRAYVAQVVETRRVKKKKSRV